MWNPCGGGQWGGAGGAWSGAEDWQSQPGPDADRTAPAADARWHSGAQWPNKGSAWSPQVGAQQWHDRGAWSPQPPTPPIPAANQHNQNLGGTADVPSRNAEWPDRGASAGPSSVERWPARVSATAPSENSQRAAPHAGGHPGKGGDASWTNADVWPRRGAAWSSGQSAADAGGGPKWSNSLPPPPPPPVAAAQGWQQQNGKGQSWAAPAGAGPWHNGTGSTMSFAGKGSLGKAAVNAWLSSQPLVKRARVQDSWSNVPGEKDFEKEKGWVEFPLSPRLGGSDWVSAMLSKEPPCLKLHGFEASSNRVSRVKPHEFLECFQRHGDRLVPRNELLASLFTTLLDGVRFPPTVVELSWRTQAVQRPKDFKSHDDLLPSDDAQIPAELRGPLKQPCSFKLLNNLADLPAQQPTHFQRHGLRKEQLRSLAWMLAREGYRPDGSGQETFDARYSRGEHEPFVAEWRQILTTRRDPAYVDLRAKASYPVRGGILADRVGFGKTATTIGLIDATRDHPMPNVPELDKDSFIPAKGTLVIVPSNLLDQWAQEISKFVWDGSRLVTLNGGWRPGRSDKACPLNVLAIGTVSPLKLITAGEISDADVVLCSYRLLFSKIYNERREDLAGDTSLSSLMKATRKVMQGQSEFNSKTLVFPLLEMFYWRRVVFDEFHELESFQDAQQSILQHVRAHSRWGLTGTPPIDTIAGVIFMSSLFRIDLPGHLPVEKIQPKKGIKKLQEVPHMLYYEDDKLVREQATKFLDRFVRQNTAELPHIALAQKVFVVQHTVAEQALYLGEAHDSPNVNWDDTVLSDGQVQSLERLLKLCSHFSAGDSGSNSNANAECEKIVEQKARRRAQEKRQLARVSRVVQILREKAKDQREDWRVELTETERSLKAQGRPGVDELVVEEIAAASESTNARCAVLAGHRPRDATLASVLAACVDGEAGVGSLRHWEAFAMRSMSAGEATALLVGQVREQIENLVTFVAAVASQEYFDRLTKVLVDGSSGQRRCCLCYEEGLALKRLTVTPCAHPICVACLRQCVQKQRACGFCKQPLQESDVRPLVNEVKGNQVSGAKADGTEYVVLAAPGEGRDAKETERISKYGSKITVLIQKLQELRQEDSTAKAILFVQFDELKMQVAAALREYGIPTAQLRGSVSHRANIIRDWQENPESKTFVLLLSLAESASGTNLTAGSHVVFLHPMLEATADRAVAHELQAIGRARRHGQKRETVHVWRFVTDGTVEQTITDRHQTTLLEREEEAKAKKVPDSAELERELRKQRQRALRNGINPKKLGL